MSSVFELVVTKIGRNEVEIVAVLTAYMATAIATCSVVHSNANAGETEVMCTQYCTT
jgi:hypothetical protein